jgi:hypothetical protein
MRCRMRILGFLSIPAGLFGGLGGALLRDKFDLTMKISPGATVSERSSRAVTSSKRLVRPSVLSTDQKLSLF